MVRENLADNFYIILSAYIAAFFPWTVLLTLDFISPTWRRVRDVRIAGYVNLIFAAIPALYIMFYIVLQAGFDDKEMFAAIVALVLVLLHLARTLWGLWQLQIFATWASQSICALRALGIEYKLNSELNEKKDAKSPNEIADELFISDELIDNRLFHGTARCYLQFGNFKVKTDPSQGNMLRQRMVLLLRILPLPFRYVCWVWYYFSGQGKALKIRQMPHKPEHVWLRWSVSFAAQGLRDWITQFQVASDPDQESSGLQLGELYERRRDYMASRVLATAGLHLWMRECVPLGGGSLVSKTELFRVVAESGIGMPFDAPQPRIAASPKRGYIAYKRKLERIIDGMPVSFGQEIEKYDIERMEWLAILLNIGRDKISRNGVRKTTEAQSKTPGCNLMMNSDIAIENLRSQLGIGDQFPGSSAKEARISSLSSFPLPERVFHSLSDKNRLVTEIGELIDCWLALLCGHQIRFLVKKDQRWTKWCRDSSKSALPSTLDDTRQCSGESPKAQSPIFMAHIGLEEARLAFQFGASFQEFDYVDQTLTFMGHSFEILRTILGRWVKAGGDATEQVWNPVVFESGKLTTQWKDFGQVSPELTSMFRDQGTKCALDDRGVQSRILWELQKASRDLVAETEGPDSMPAMALCMLSYPSLVFMNVEDRSGGVQGTRNSQKEERVEITDGDNCVSVLFTSQNNKNSNQDKRRQGRIVQFAISPQCGPQNLLLHVQLRYSVDTVLKTFLRLCRGSRIENRDFHWQSWRDSAMGRMKGLKDWQTNHGMRSPDLHISNAGIASGIRKEETGLLRSRQEVLVWLGWNPFRVKQCRLELEGENVLKKFLIERDIGVPVRKNRRFQLQLRRVLGNDISLTYEDATGDSLRDGCSLVEEITNSKAQKSENSQDVNLVKTRRAKRLISEAKYLLSKSSGNCGRATFLLKIAALEWESIDALRLCVSYLMDSRLKPLDTATSSNPTQAAEVLKGFFDGRVENHMKQPGALPNNDEFDILFSMFASLVERQNFDEEILDDFCGFLRSAIENRMCTFIERCLNWIRRIALRSRKPMHIMGLAINSTWGIEGSSRAIAHERTSDEIESFSFFSKNLLTDHDSRIAFNLMSKSVLERVIAEQTGLLDSDLLPVLIFLRGPAPILFRKNTMEMERTPVFKKTSYCNSPNENPRYIAMMHLGLLLTVGAAGVIPDGRKAVSLYEAATGEPNCGGALRNLGIILEHGIPGIRRNPSRARSLYEKAIYEYGDVFTLVNLASLLEDGGDGVVQDTGRAIELYESAIEKCQDERAFFCLANLFKNGGNDVLPQPTRAVKLYERAIEKHTSVDSMINLGNLLRDGAEGVEPDGRKAKHLYELAIEHSDDVFAMGNLAMLLDNGAAGVRANPPRAAILYERVIDECNHVGVMVNFGLLLKNGAEGVERNPIRAAALFQRGVDEHDDAGAMFNLAVMLEDGDTGLQKNAIRAAHLYEVAVRKHGHRNSMYNLAVMMQYGANGVERDVERAKELFELAVNTHNDVKAMVALGRLFISGVERDEFGAARAIKFFERAIEAGEDGSAMFHLGSLLWTGATGVERNSMRAVELFERAIERCDHSDAMMRLATILKNGEGEFECNSRRAAVLYQRAIDHHNKVEAMFQLGYMLRMGTGGLDQDAKRAVELFEQAIERGNDSRSMYMLAEILRNGADGVLPDVPRAASLYTRLIQEHNDANHDIAMLRLSSLLEGGAEGLEADAPRAVQLYEQAIENPSHAYQADAMVFLASLLHTGANGVGADAPRAVALYENAGAEEDNVFAMVQLGLLLMVGAENVEPDGQRAVSLFERAIEKFCNRVAMFTLGMLMKNGVEGVAVNPARAVDLFERAIDEWNDVEAMLALGDMLENGADGVERNVNWAASLYERAMEHGNQEAAARLAALFESQTGGGGDDSGA